MIVAAVTPSFVGIVEGEDTLCGVDITHKVAQTVAYTVIVASAIAYRLRCVAVPVEEDVIGSVL